MALDGRGSDAVATLHRSHATTPTLHAIYNLAIYPNQLPFSTAAPRMCRRASSTRIPPAESTLLTVPLPAWAALVRTCSH